jgi:hypothetical protein
VEPRLLTGTLNVAGAKDDFDCSGEVDWIRQASTAERA